jgi:hypothetical protein
VKRKLKLISLISATALSLGTIIPLSISAVKNNKDENININKNKSVIYVQEDTKKNEVSHVIAEINNFSNYSYGYGRIEL